MLSGGSELIANQAPSFQALGLHLSYGRVGLTAAVSTDENSLSTEISCLHEDRTKVLFALNPNNSLLSTGVPVHHFGNRCKTFQSY